MIRPIATLHSLWPVFRAYVNLVRLGNVLMVGFAVYLGAFIVQGESFSVLLPSAMRASMALAFLAAAGNVMNDVIDVHRDRINKPSRPLVTGIVSIRMATVLLGVLAVASVGLVSTLSTVHHLVFGCIGLVLVAYNLWLSKLPLVGNLSIAIIVAMSIPFGGLGVTLTPTIWIAAGFAFLTTLAREIIKDVQDEEGDRQCNARTLPILWGIKPSVNLVYGISIAIVLVSVVPYVHLQFGGMYLLLMVVTNLLLILPMTHEAEPKEKAPMMSTTLKWVMVLGMIALALSETIPVL